MTSNTTQALDIINNQVKAFDRIRSLITMFTYIAYSIYKIVTDKGYIILNCILLGLTVLYAINYIIKLSLTNATVNKKTEKIIKKLYKYSKLVFTATGLGLSISAFLSLTASEITPINLVLAIIMPLLWCLQLIFDIFLEYVYYCYDLIHKGVENDITQIKDTITKPIQVAKKVGENVIDMGKNLLNRYRNTTYIDGDNSQNDDTNNY